MVQRNASLLHLYLEYKVMHTAALQNALLWLGEKEGEKPRGSPQRAPGKSVSLRRA